MNTRGRYSKEADLAIMIAQITSSGTIHSFQPLSNILKVALENKGKCLCTVKV